MKAQSLSRGVSARALRGAARLLLCLALALLPLSAASAAHFDGAAAASLGHDHDSGPESPDAHAPLCHHVGACYAFVTPAAPSLAPLRIAARAEIPRLREPASAAVHRLFRPPIAGARA